MPYPAIFKLSDLDGTNGFVLRGIDEADYAGISVSSAGDVNGDGFDDIIIGASGGNAGGSGSGESYVVFGKASGFTPSIFLSLLDGTNGFQLAGAVPNSYSGRSVSSAGDVNGDGFDDIIIGAPTADPGGETYAGESYVVFGKASGFAASIDLATLNGANGFRIQGIGSFDYSGRSVSSAGDINGDGFDDLIIGASGANGFDGESYVIFGGTLFSPIIELSTLDGMNGFRLPGIDGSDNSGFSVSGLGDVNGDGFDDIIVNAASADVDGNADAGESYVVFGNAGGFTASLDLAALNGVNGFRLEGVDAADRSGISVSSAGDVNGDGFADIIIGASGADPGGDESAGESYVVFGKASGFGAAVDLGALDGANGFRLDGIDTDDFSGRSVSSAGDVNGDGFDDVIIGAARGDPGGGDQGESYVVFGKASGFAPVLPLSALNGVNGFRLDGINADDRSGWSVSSAGDVNNDGFADIFIGAPFADRIAFSNGSLVFLESAGEAYVVFGLAPDTAVNRVGAGGSQQISGGDFNDTLSGLGGNDTLLGGVGNDILIGGSGGDRLLGASGSDTIAGGSGADSLNGQSGTDTLDYSASSSAVNINLDTQSATGGHATGDTIAGFENAIGGSGADTLVGSDGNNRLEGGVEDDLLLGGLGNDTLVGSSGEDTLDGGMGNDRVFGSVAGDSIMGGGGNDTLQGNNGNDFIDGGSGGDRILGGPADDVIFGNSGNDTILGNNNEDTIDGGAGGDLIFGGALADSIRGDEGGDVLRGNGGDDTIRGGSGGDSILGQANADLLYGDENSDTVGGNGASDTVFGGTGADLLRGNAGDDIVYGEGGADQLLGGNGDDVIVGGAGEDRLAGNNGRDVFIFGEGDSGSTLASADLITDFSQSENDKIRLVGIDAIAGGGDDAFDFVGTAAFSGTAGELRYEQSGGDTNVFADTDGDGTADFALRLLGDVDLVAGDFVL